MKKNLLFAITTLTLFAAFTLNADDESDLEWQESRNEERQVAYKSYQHRHRRRCLPDSVEVGSWCVDRYEASTWQTAKKRLTAHIKSGTIRSERQLLRNATRRGDGVDDYDEADCPDTGNGCTKVYAVSIPHVNPSNFLTWMQALATCRNSGKQLIPNAIWQAAAMGTPAPGDAGDGVSTCNTNTTGVVPTGSTGDCVSDTGVFDMVGNVNEWVADWAPVTDGCVTPLFGSGDFNCYAASGRASVGGPGPLARGGAFNNRDTAGVFSVDVFRDLEAREDNFGFRCGSPKVR